MRLIIQNTDYAQAKKIIWVYGIGILVFVISVNTPFSIPCLWKLATGIPCPGCGLTRAFVLVSRLDFVGAAGINILALPLLTGAIMYFMCALIEITVNKPALRRFNSMLEKKWVIAIAITLMALSWHCNITRGI